VLSPLLAVSYPVPKLCQGWKALELRMDLLRWTKCVSIHSGSDFKGGHHKPSKPEQLLMLVLMNCIFALGRCAVVQNLFLAKAVDPVRRPRPCTTSEIAGSDKSTAVDPQLL
jgi:hypothetical protein